MIQKPRGTQDIFDNDVKQLFALETKIRNVLNNYNFTEIRTPIFESKELFVRSVGETSDVVSKEMYEFLDKKNRQFVLRPEGTAPVVRALIENKLYTSEHLPFKVFYLGPMFRYERPQVGRTRQFHQFGIEVFGPNNFNQDFEIVALAFQILKELKLENKVKLHLNYLVTGQQREKYIRDLKKYLSTFELCDDCLQRIKTNPLRVLDCKIDGHKFIDAPKMSLYLKKEDSDYFEQLINLIKILNVELVIDEKLVRGLDYYTGFVFEYKYNSNVLGSQSTLIGGGRYNNLVKELNGPDLPAAGFGLGIERFVIALNEMKINLINDNKIDLFTIALTNEAKELNNKIIYELRDKGLKVETDYLNKSLKSAFKQSEKLNADWVLIIGDQEIKDNKFNLKNQKNNDHIETSLENIYFEIMKGKNND